MSKTHIATAIVYFFLFSSFTLSAGEAAPLYGTWDFKPEKIWETDSAGPDLFAWIRTIDVGPDGRIYTFDVKHFKIYILNPDGSYVSSFGNRGEGPGELKNIGKARHFFDR